MTLRVPRFMNGGSMGEALHAQEDCDASPAAIALTVKCSL
jgi:hypothetical protein